MKQIMVRMVPDASHRKLKIMAAQQGITMNDLLLGLIEEAIGINRVVTKGAKA